MKKGLLSITAAALLAGSAYGAETVSLNKAQKSLTSFAPGMKLESLLGLDAKSSLFLREASSLILVRRSAA